MTTGRINQVASPQCESVRDGLESRSGGCAPPRGGGRGSRGDGGTPVRKPLSRGEESSLSRSGSELTTSPRRRRRGACVRARRAGFRRVGKTGRTTLRRKTNPRSRRRQGAGPRAETPRESGGGRRKCGTARVLRGRRGEKRSVRARTGALATRGTRANAPCLVEHERGRRGVSSRSIQSRGSRPKPKRTRTT